MPTPETTWTEQRCPSCRASIVTSHGNEQQCPRCNAVLQTLRAELEADPIWRRERARERET